MATHVSHSALPFPVRNARYTVVVPFMDADGDPTDPTATLDTEISVDAGSFNDAAEELTVIGSGAGWGMVTLSGAEMNNSLIVGQVRNGGTAKAAQFAVQPRTLPVILSGTAQAGAAGTITFPSGAAAIDDVYNGCIVKTTGGTGGGGTGGANNQARVIKNYVGSTRVATIEPNWEVAPDTTTTLEVLATDLAAVTSPALASAILDEALSGHNTAGTVGKALIDILAAVDTEIAAILADTNELQTDWANGGRLDLLIDAIMAKTDNLPSDPADASDIAAQFASLPTAAQNAAALLDFSNGIETGITPRQAMRLMLAAMVGKLSGAATTTITIRNVGDTVNRIVADVDANGNRTSVTTNAT